MFLWFMNRRFRVLVVCVFASANCTARRTPLEHRTNVAPSVHKLTHGTEDDALLGSRRELGVRGRGTSVDQRARRF